MARRRDHHKPTVQSTAWHGDGTRSRTDATSIHSRRPQWYGDLLHRQESSKRDELVGRRFEYRHAPHTEWTSGRHSDLAAYAFRRQSARIGIYRADQSDAALRGA